MQTADFQIYAPAFFTCELSEAAVLGSVVWLWFHSQEHRDIPLACLADTSMPFISRGQYLLISEAQRPAAMLSWAWFDETAERRYLTQPFLGRPESDWFSGDRLWFMDWVAPFGHSREMSRLLLRELFTGHCIRSLYHRGRERGKRVKFFAGAGLSAAEISAWRNTHPLTVSLPEAGTGTGDRRRLAVVQTGRQ